MDRTDVVGLVGIYLVLPALLFLAAVVVPTFVFAPISLVLFSVIAFYQMSFFFRSPSRPRASGSRPHGWGHVMLFFLTAFGISVGL